MEGACGGTSARCQWLAGLMKASTRLAPFSCPNAKNVIGRGCKLTSDPMRADRRSEHWHFEACRWGPSPSPLHPNGLAELYFKCCVLGNVQLSTIVASVRDLGTLIVP